MTYSIRDLALTTLLLACWTSAAGATGLKGSEASMVHQHAIAVEEQYTFLRTPLDIQRLASDGQLVPVTSDADLRLAGVSFPYTRPEVRAFVRRFAKDYRDSTGVPLTVTSLTRPLMLQPTNAHKLSVHPAGMAVDMRVPATEAERVYLERALLRMEAAGLLDVTREHIPAHYHVAVFATPMNAYLATRDSADARQAAILASTRAATARQLSAVTHAPAYDSLDEARVPLFLFAMLALLGLALSLLHPPAHARRWR